MKNATVNRITLVELDYTVKPNTVKLLRTDNGYKCTESYDDKQAMHKRVWYIAHSPKLLGITIKTNYYSNDIRSLLAYFNMQDIACTIITKAGKFNTTKEFDTWFSETQHANDMANLTQENINLIIEYAKELIKYAKDGTLTEVLQTQIRLSGYDVSMSSIDTTDGLNSGVIDDGHGGIEWSRNYTKHYERYNTQLNDLLKMYISCKFLHEHGYDADGNALQKEIDKDTSNPRACDTCGWNDCKNCPHLTRGTDTTADEVVVPVSACGEYTQMLFN